MSDIPATLQERGEQYGSFAVQSAIAQTLKRAVRECPNWPKLKPDQREAIDHILTKLSRVLNGNPDHLDSWVDVAGYAQLIVNRLSQK